MVHVMGYSIVLKLLKTNLYLCNMLVISIPISPEMPTAANAGGFISPKFGPCNEQAMLLSKCIYFVSSGLYINPLTLKISLAYSP